MVAATGAEEEEASVCACAIWKAARLQNDNDTETSERMRKVKGHPDLLSIDPMLRQFPGRVKNVAGMTPRFLRLRTKVVHEMVSVHHFASISLVNY